MEHQKAVTPVRKVYERLYGRDSNRSTITRTEYDSNRDKGMSSSATLVKQMSWESILAHLELAPNLSRNTRATLSNSLHLLQKRIVNELSLGWEEFSLIAPNSSQCRNFRPDSLCMDSLYLPGDRMVVLDVKLSAESGIKTIYRYLPMFEEGLQTPLTEQATFFPQWLPNNAVNIEQQVLVDGQMSMFWENHVLYICYLLGDNVRDLAPGSIIGKKYGEKRLLDNLEVRFIHFSNLPKLYCDIAGIDYTSEMAAKMQPVLDLANYIGTVTQAAKSNTSEVAEKLYQLVKSGTPCEEILAQLT
jgi:hypothetical protein